MVDKTDFCLEEFKALRKEIEIYLVETRTLERNTIIAIGAIWGFLIANHVNHPLPWMMPIAIAVAAEAMVLAGNKHFGSLSKYIASIETGLSTVGWETKKKDRPRPFNIAHNIIICGLIAISFLGYCKREELATSAHSSAEAMQTQRPGPQAPTPTAEPKGNVR